MPTQLKSDRPECDIAKTQTMVDLFQIPQDERDDKWQQSFCEQVQTASYACGNPQIFTGPDSFPYFILKTPEPNQPFESFCIRNMKDDFLLDRGLGVAINPKEGSVDWVFSFGDIVNLHLNKEFFTETGHTEIQNVETLTKDEKVLVAQPSENYLPEYSRRALRSFLQSSGIKKPKIMMICRTIEGQVIQELAFNIFPEDFSSTEQLNFRLKQISWFLPRHYIVIAFSKNSGLVTNYADL
jgi:hypothetical protein